MRLMESVSSSYSFGEKNVSLRADLTDSLSFGRERHDYCSELVAKSTDCEATAGHCGRSIHSSSSGLPRPRITAPEKIYRAHLICPKSINT